MPKPSLRGSHHEFFGGRNPKNESPITHFNHPKRFNKNLVSIWCKRWSVCFMTGWGNDGCLLPCLRLWLLRQASLHSAASYLVDSTLGGSVVNDATSRKGWVEKGEGGLRDIQQQYAGVHHVGFFEIRIVDLIVWELATSCRILQFSSESIKHDLFKDGHCTPEKLFRKIQEPLTHPRTLMEPERSAQNSVSTKVWPVKRD